MGPEKYKSLSFSTALDLLKIGKKMSRAGWNGRGMFVYLVEGSTFTADRAPLNTILPEGTQVTYRPHIDLKAADGTCGVWSPSNSDVLDTDWEVVD